MTDASIVEQMWRAFDDRTLVRDNIIDTSGQTISETVRAAFEGLDHDRFKLA